ncbi:hypothetical protein K492DRAFT_129238 [Lichtheimia hyalospora FSU 10163]|nr:hypothetical protein K492DRAFT_129238 [Lichtheimia hyalospora FSU 10163]
MDDTTGPLAADAPKLQRRSLKTSTANGGGSRLIKKPTTATAAASTTTVRSSVSSTEELSEPESLSFTANTTPRTSWNRSSPVKDEQQPSTLVVGNRVSVPSLQVQGTLRFLGPTSFKAGTWAGIELDTVGGGKNDGCVQGIRYFSCPPQTGLFILDSKVSPVIDPSPSQQQQQNDPSHVDKATTPSKILRTSKQPMPERTRSSMYTRRSKSSASPSPLKLTASKTLSTRSTAEKRPSRFSLGASSKNTEPVPPLPKSNSIHFSPSTAPDLNDNKSSTPEIPDTPAAPESTSTTENKETTATQDKNIVSREELYQIYDLLEKTRDEKEKLMAEMNNKESAWERLVSTKESYALQVQEKEEAMTRLRHQLDETREQCTQLEQQLLDKDAMIAQNVKDDAAHEQYQKRIEKLEALVEELSNKSSDTAEAHKMELEQYATKMDQMQHALSDQETMTATLEKECEELRRAGLEAIHAYETSVQELKKQKDDLSEEKETEIGNLNRAIEDLRQRSIAMGVLDVDEELGYRDTYADEWHDQRQRLEEQLELAMTELEQERLHVQSLTVEVDKLQKEMQRLHMDSSASDDRYHSLQQELEQEVKDKRRLMEEADAAFEAQARAEDENYQMKMAQNAKMALEKECQQLRHANKDMEQECIRLMDEMLALEKPDDTGNKENDDTPALKARIAQLEHELLDERRRLDDLELAKHTEINHLNKELAELETLVESRVFGEADMEQALDAERRRTRELEKELRTLKDSPKHNDKTDSYCELCEYCENCEQHNTHSTEDCPNQDEVF